VLVLALVISVTVSFAAVASPTGRSASPVDPTPIKDGYSPPTPPPQFNCIAFASSLQVVSPSHAITAPAAGIVGTVFELEGSGYYNLSQGSPMGYFNIWMANYSGGDLLYLAYVPAGAFTDFFVNVTVPSTNGTASFGPGPYEFWSLENYTTVPTCANAAFDLTGAPPPSLGCLSWSAQLRITSPIPANGTSGTPVSLQGRSFSPAGDTTIYWANATGSPEQTVGTTHPTSPGGWFNQTFDVPSGYAVGLFVFWAVDDSFDCAGAVFNFTGGPSLALTPATGAGGTDVTVTGTGFAVSDSSISITGRVLLFALPCTLSDGSITGSCFFQVDGGLAGPQTITGVGNVVGGPGDTANATFILYPSILLNQTAGPGGSLLSVSGFDFSAGPAAAFVTFDGQLLTPTGGSDCAAGASHTLIRPDDLGQFDCDFTVPAWATSGSNSVQGDDTNTSELTALVTFTLTTPELTLSPMSGPTGTVVTASGAGFSLGVGITFSISTSGAIGSAGPCSSSDAGSFTGCVFAVSGPEIAYTITATGADSSAVPADSASASFTVTAGLTITSTPLTGPPGTSIVVTGSGYTPGYGIELEFGVTYPTAVPAQPCIGVPVNASGGFICMFSAPEVGQGVYSVWSAGGGVGLTASTNTFTILAELAFSSAPLTGPPGTSVNVTGLGYVPGTGAELEFGETLPTSILMAACVGIPVNATGGFTCTFPVPEVGAGVYMVWSSGGGVYLTPSSNTFTVVAELAFSSTPLTGPPGTLVNVTGLGYVPGTGAELAFGATFMSGTLVDPCVGIPVNATGGFTCTFSVPDVAAGVYHVWSSGGGVYLTVSTNNFTVTAPDVVGVSSTTGTPGPITFSVSGLAPNTLYDVYLDTTPGMESTLLGTCTSSAGGAITDCTVVIPTGLATGTYYVDLFQDPMPPPYILSIFHFAVAPAPPPSSGLSYLDYEVIAGVIVVAAIGAAIAASRRRGGRTPPTSTKPPTAAPPRGKTSN